MTHYTLLPGRGIVSVSGVDARSFLQGLVTVDALKLDRAHPRYGMLLTPQGKFLHDFFLIDDGERVFIDAEKARLADLLGRLRMYKLRAQVEIAEVSGLEVYALWGGGAPASSLMIADPSSAALGWRVYAQAPPEAELRPFTEYDALRLSLGVPDGSRDMVPERTLPLEAGIDRLHGIDFDKGCYVGQEVTARSKFRASLRKQLYVVRTDALPEAGTPIMHGEQQVGEMRSSSGSIGLAMLNYDAVEQSGGQLQGAGTVIAATLPPWAEGFGNGDETAGKTPGKGV